MNEINVNVGSNMCSSLNNNIFQLSQEEYDAIKEECMHYENTRAVSIEALKIIQKRHGWVPDEAIALIAQLLNISESDVEGVATFYNQIFRQPVGRHIVRYCDSIVCYLGGCKEIEKTLICVLNITLGQTTVDNRFTLLPTCCLGLCDKAPIMMINKDIYFKINPKHIIQALGHYL